MTKILLLMTAALFGLVACTDTKNSDSFSSSVQFSDSHVYNRFIEELDKSGIKYRKGKDQFIFYSASDSEKIAAITSAINAKYYPGCGASFDDKAEQAAVEGELKRRKIPFSVVELDHGPTITCSPEHRDALEQVIRARGASGATSPSLPGY